MRRVILIALISVCTALPYAQGQSSLTLNKSQFAQERIDIYKDFLRNFREDGQAINLADTAEPLTKDALAREAGECLNGLTLESSVRSEAHKFSPDDFISDNSIRIVNPAQQKKEVEANDPQREIQRAVQGRKPDIEGAVRKAFNSGLFTFSEIIFDKSHTHAVLTYAFYCGTLCGSGGAVLYEKVNGAWHRNKRSCSSWVS